MLLHPEPGALINLGGRARVVASVGKEYDYLPGGIGVRDVELEDVSPTGRYPHTRGDFSRLYGELNPGAYI